MPPCLIISMISSTGILQLTSYIDTKKDQLSILKTVEPMKIVAGPKKMSATNDSQTMTAKATVPTVAAKATVTAAAMPTFGSGQPPIPVKAPNAFTGFGTGAAAMTTAATVKATTTTTTTTTTAAATTIKLPISNTTPIDITNFSLDGTVCISSDIYTPPSTLADKYHHPLSKNRSEVDDFQKMYSKNISDDLKTGSVIALAMEARMSSFKSKCLISHELMMRDLPVLLGKVKRIIGTGDVHASYSEDGSSLEAALDALSIDQQPKNLLKRLKCIQQQMVQTRSLINSRYEDSFSSQNFLSQRRFEGRPLPVSGNGSSGQSVDISQYPLNHERHYAAMRIRKEFRIHRRKKWNGLVEEIQHHRRKATPNCILYTDFKVLEKDCGDYLLPGGSSQSAQKNQNLYILGRETSDKRSAKTPDNTMHTLTKHEASSNHKQDPMSKLPVEPGPFQLTSTISSDVTEKYHSISQPPIPSKAPSAFGGFGQPTAALAVAAVTGSTTSSSSSSSSNASQSSIPLRLPGTSLFSSPAAPKESSKIFPSSGGGGAVFGARLFGTSGTNNKSTGQFLIPASASSVFSFGSTEAATATPKVIPGLFASQPPMTSGVSSSSDSGESSLAVPTFSSTSQLFTPLKASGTSSFGGPSMSTPAANMIGKPSSFGSPGPSPVSFALSPSAFATTPSTASTPFGTPSSSLLSMRPAMSSLGAPPPVPSTTQVATLNGSSSMLPQFGQQSSIGFGRVPIVGSNQASNAPQFGQSASAGPSAGLTPSRNNLGAGLFGSSAAGNELGSGVGAASFGGLGSTPSFGQAATSGSSTFGTSFGQAATSGSSTFGIKSPDTGAKSSFSGANFMTFRSS